MSRLTRDGTAGEPVSRDRILRREQRGQGNINFLCSADHEQDCQPYPVDPCCCLKRNQNAPRPSEHLPVRGGGISKRLGWIKGCKYKTSSWYLNGFPDGIVTLGQQYNVGEKPTVILTVHLH